MYYARAFEQRVLAMQQAFSARGVRPPVRPSPTPSGQARPALPSAAPSTPVVTRPFHRLTTTEQLERRRKGLCFNCDESYAPGHVCARLFYLETVDDADVDVVAVELEDATIAESDAAPHGPAQAAVFVVSLHALAGIQTEKTMLLPVTIHGERLLTMLDMGSTHNFLSGAAMHRLALQPAGAEQFSVTVANGDRLACQGVARQVPILIGDEHFSITCVGIDLGCFDFILGVHFLRTLGPILWDFDALTLIYWRLGRPVRWQCVRGASPTAPNYT